MSYAKPQTDESIETEQRATAKVNTTPEGDVLGVALFLGSDELAELGITDSDRVGYTIENGQLQLRGVSKDGK